MSDTIDLPAMSTLKPASSYVSTSIYEAVKLRLGKAGLAATKPQTIPEFFRDSCLKYAQRPALRFQSSGTDSSDSWTTCSYTDYAQHVEQAALLLLHIGLQPHSSIGILAFNCPEWFYAELGALRAGGVVAGIYPSNSAEAVHHVLDTSEATVCIVDDSQQMAKVRAVKSRLPRLRAVVQLHGPFEEFVGVDDGYYRWSDLVSVQYGEELKEELLRREQDVMANECALLIYTSGTVGMPKAVMLTHDSVIYDAKAISDVLPNLEQGEEVGVTYLPLNHIAAQVFDIFMSIENGACVYFADKNALKGTLGKTLAQARPTRFLGVPRVYEKIEEKLTSVEAKKTGFAKYFMEKARQTVQNYHLEQMQHKSPSGLYYWLATRVTRQIKYALGMDRCKSFIIGGAPVNDDLKLFFLSIDITLNDIFGMSETSGAATLHFDIENLSNVGKAIEGVELKIFNPDQDGQGEICVRGRTTFMGYLNDMGNTKETLREDGWLHTGDIGFLDTAGNLNVSGRIKELIITAGGENIPPVHIEDMVKRELHGISNAMLVGDRRKYLTMLLTIKTDFDTETGLPLDTLRSEAIEWLESLGLHFTRLSEVLDIPSNMQDVDAANVAMKPHPKVLQAIQDAIAIANTKAISNAQRVQKFSLLPHDFSVPTGELGPTLKLRRNIVLQKYGNIIENMYKS